MIEQMRRKKLSLLMMNPIMTAEKVKKVGADDYIVKPFEPEELTDKVEEILAQGANL